MSFVSSVINVFWGHKLKRNSDVETFRYTRLYELHVELHSIESVITKPRDTLCERVNRVIVFFDQLRKIYFKALPLMEDTQKTKEVVRLHTEAVDENTRYIQSNPKPDDVVESYILSIYAFHDALVEAIKENLEGMIH